MVEITLAIGIFGFCILGLIGMVPVGMRAGRDADNQQKATQISVCVASEIWGATSVPKSLETLYGLSLDTAGTQTRKLDETGLTNNSTTDPYYSLSVVITTNALTGNNCARISVAWPSRALWNPSLNAWSNALGSVESTILYDAP